MYDEMDMDERLYEMIFKRKSFHLFRDKQTMPTCLPDEILKIYADIEPLCENIKTKAMVCPAAQTNCMRGAEYCILLYSERKENYLQNIGYIGERLDLSLAAMNIGALWLGSGRIERQCVDGLDFVIMIAIAAMPPDRFRKDMFACKRKKIEDIWHGNRLGNVAETVRFAPSACNLQPWKVEADARNLELFLNPQSGKRGIMPASMVGFYNRIDMGIFMQFLELCLHHNGFVFERTVMPDCTDAEKQLCAGYRLIC